MNNTKKALKTFYNSQYKKFHHTRKKSRPEFHHIAKVINKHPSQDIAILELGCGDGRLLDFLIDKTDKNISYTGIDIADKLLTLGKERHPTQSFVCKDMYTALGGVKTETYDFVIAIASIQHLPSQKERIQTLQRCYRALQYGGKLIMVNWSFSWWFIKKYRKNIGKSMIQGARNDLQIPRKNNEKTLMRYYHIFTIPEIKKLLKKTSFHTSMLIYCDKAGRLSKKRFFARNTLCICKKSITKG